MEKFRHNQGWFCFDDGDFVSGVIGCAGWVTDCVFILSIESHEPCYCADACIAVRDDQAAFLHWQHLDQNKSARRVSAK